MKKQLLAINSISRFASERFLGTLLICLFLSGCTQMGGGAPDLTTLMTNLTTQFPQIIQLVSAFCYLSGIAFIVRGIMALKVYGEGRSMMSQEHGLKKPLTYIGVGTVLLFSPTTINVAMMTVFSDSNPMAYPTGGSTGNNIYDGVLMFTQLIGFISFVRGWFKLSHPGQGGQSNIGPALTHIVGGLCAMNIGNVITILQNSITSGGTG